MSGARWRPAFIQNRGEQPEAVRYFTDSDGDRLFLTTDAAVWVYKLPDTVWPIALRLPGATTIQLVERAPGVISLFRGPDARRWPRGLERWSAVRYVEPWPGIDLTFRVGDDLTWFFDVAPGADPATLELRWEGVSGLQLDDEGDLLLTEGDLHLFHPRPVATQVGSSVSVSYQLLGADRVGFRLGSYDPHLPVRISIARQGSD